jgi:hypothetical protein
VHLERFSVCVFLSSTKTKNRGLPRRRADIRPELVEFIDDSLRSNTLVREVAGRCKENADDLSGVRHQWFFEQMVRAAYRTAWRCAGRHKA